MNEIKIEPSIAIYNVEVKKDEIDMSPFTAFNRKTAIVIDNLINKNDTYKSIECFDKEISKYFNNIKNYSKKFIIREFSSKTRHFSLSLKKEYKGSIIINAVSIFYKENNHIYITGFNTFENRICSSSFDTIDINY